MKWVGVLAAAAAMMFGAGTAQASLIGDQVTVSYLFPEQSSIYATQTVTVGAGSEVVCPGATALCAAVPAVDIDLAASSVTVRLGFSSFFTIASFNGLSFEDLDFGGGAVLSGVALDTNIAGLDLSRVSFGDDFARINMSGFNFTSESFFAFNFTTRAVSEVPEPATLGLLGLGLIGMGLGLRRRRFN